MAMQHFWEFWWLVFPLAGIVGGWGRAMVKAGERKREQQIELAKAKSGSLTLPPGDSSTAPVNLAKTATEAFTEADVERTMQVHDAANRRWLDYELDVGKLIDFPMMTDVRNPLTVAFLRAKRDADALKPVAAGEIKSKVQWDDYRNAVNAYDVALEVAEKEAHRIKDSEFSDSERQRLATARKLINVAENEAATAPERRTAYQRARKELDGLLVLPDITVASLEQKAAGILDQ